MTAPAIPQGRFARVAGWIGDRLNPILIREVNQALNGRGLVITGGLTLAAILFIALLVAAQGRNAAGSGDETFAGILLVLIPLLLFVVPVQAFISMRQEVTRGTVDHLHLSRLGPGAIVRGKLAATMVQFVLYFSIFSPLLAMTYLLRGVDIPTIALCLAILLACGLGACSLAVACGALCRWKSVFRILPLIFVIVGLGGVTISMMTSFATWIMFRSFLSGPDDAAVWQILIGVCGPVLVGVAFCGLIGASALAHPYENRSTGFRVFAIASLFVGAVWVIAIELLASGGVAPGSPSGQESLPIFVGVAGALLALFPIFAATEERGMSPRVRSRVPRRRILALLVVPFLPGGGRGVLFGLILAVVAMTIAAVGPPLALLAPPEKEALGATVIIWMYVLLYTGAAGFLRGLLPRGMRWSWVARAMVPIVFFGSILLPILVGALTQRVDRPASSAFDYLNPAMVVNRYHDRPGQMMAVAVVLALIWGIITVLDMKRIAGSVAEVLAASRARRERGAD